MEYVPGPDFPTAGIINGAAGIHAAYHTGRGRVRMKARADVEVNEDNGRESIIVTELPYQVRKGGDGGLILKIRDLVLD
jgi:DNA gyrase subunit A